MATADWTSRIRAISATPETEVWIQKMSEPPVSSLVMSLAFSEEFGEEVQKRVPFAVTQTLAESVEMPETKPQVEAMSEMNREEVKARLEASEARVATVVESMRADSEGLRFELREGLSQIKVLGQISQANADKFYADAHKMMAESRTVLTEIKLAGEQNRTNVMAMGYKFAAWIFGAVIALSGLYFTVQKAIADRPAAASIQISPAPAPSASQPPAAPAK
jgi:hypothetical protein